MNAIIEIGTNSLKLLIYRTEPSFEAVFDKTVITRLSENYNKTGKISLQALKRNIQEMKRNIEVIKNYNCQNIYLYGTMIFRSASNSEEVLNHIFLETGLRLQILSGQEEAKYSFLAANHCIKSEFKNSLVVDTGGGSTEFIFGKANKLEFAQSLDIGAVTLTDKYKLENEVSESVLEQCNDYLIKQLNNISLDSRPEIIIGIGGTVTTISAIIQKLDPYLPEKIQNSIINLNDIIQLENELSLKNLESRKNIIGLSPKRADIILGGLLIIKSILQKYRVTEMIVCDQGLRYGLALKEWRKK